MPREACVVASGLPRDSGLGTSFVSRKLYVTYFFKEPVAHLYQTETQALAPPRLLTCFDQSEEIARILVS